MSKVTDNLKVALAEEEKIVEALITDLDKKVAAGLEVGSAGWWAAQNQIVTATNRCGQMKRDILDLEKPMP